MALWCPVAACGDRLGSLMGPRLALTLPKDSRIIRAYLTNDQSRLRRDDACGGHAGYPPHVPRDGRAVEMKRRCLIRSGLLPTGVPIKPALFASRVRE